MNEIKKLLKEKKKAIEQGQYKEAASACNAIGSEYLNLEKYDEALQEHLEELQYCEKINDQLGIAVANRRIGECYTMLNNFKQALFHIRKFYDISVSLKSVIEEQRAWATFGRTYYLKYQHEYASGNNKNSLSKTLDQAELAYYKALKLLHTLGSEIKPIELAEMKCRLLLNLGLVCETRGDNEGGSKHVKVGLDIALKHGLYEDIHRCAYALGTMYQKFGKHVEAEEVLNKALTATEKLHNKNLICEVLLSKGINLISLEQYDEAIKVLKRAYKTRTTNDEDFQKIIKCLKVCIGINTYKNKLKTCKDSNDRKGILEKIADGLSSIDCYKQAVEYYLLTLNCIKEDDLSKKAPIYYSLAQTYLDDGNVSKALEYFEKEYNCHKENAVEQVKTAWKMAEILEGEGKIDKSEKLYVIAVSLSEQAGDKKIIHSSLSKLLSFYNSINKINLAEDVRKKLNGIRYECSSDEESENEDSQDPFNEIHLSELSDSDDNEEEITVRKRRKQVETKVNEKGETPLHQACINGNLNMVKRLVENGHSVNVRDYAGWTPLHEACNYGFYDIAEFLLENGADINDPGGPNCKGITALHDAASCGNFDVIRLLISKGASVTVVDENGETPLDALLQWKKRAFKELNNVELEQCKTVEDELKSKMAKAGMSVDEDLLDNMTASDHSSDISYQSIRTREKRNRSPSLSSGTDFDDNEIDDISPYLSVNNTEDWNDAVGAKAEYKSVMENLRRSAADISPVKTQAQAPRVINGPSLVNENEIVNEWLIKDTNEIPKAKKKKRRLDKLNVRTSKCNNNYLIPQDSSNEKEKSRITFLNEDDSNISISSAGSVGENNAKDNSTQSFKSESSKVSFCLRVNIAGILILIPIPEDTCTISWLMAEAAQRYQNLNGSKPHLTLTKDGALLSGTDLIKDIFLNNEEVLSTVEMWDEPSLEEKYVQLCEKFNATISSSVKKRFQCLKTSELNFSNCNISSSHLKIIFYTVLNYKSLQHLNFSGTVLTHSNVLELVSCLPSFSVLVTLNLSCCNLTSQCIQIMTDYLEDQMPKKILPLLRILDLSYNIFTECSYFTAFLKLNSLVSLNLSSCGLNSSLFSSKLFEAMKEKQNLEELNISGNVFADDEISNFLCHLPRKNLKKLNLKHIVEKESGLGFKLQTFLIGTVPYLTELILQGCSLMDADLNKIAECLSCCPKLQICDLSTNPSLSSHCMYNFINKVYENNLSVTDINIIGTCVWDEHNCYSLIEFLKLRMLKHFCFDNCPENTINKIMHMWTVKWGSAAVCSNVFVFCELSVK